MKFHVENFAEAMAGISTNKRKVCLAETENSVVFPAMSCANSETKLLILYEAPI